MADGSRRQSIPAWQAANPQPVAATNTPSNAATTESSSISTDSTMISLAPTEAHLVPKDNEKEQREQIRAFLQDERIKSESVEKQRAFLLSKDMPASLIDDELRNQTDTTVLQVKNFNDFQQQSSPSSHEESYHDPPAPIITYPEFLANAHSPAPLVTPASVLATSYIAAAAAVLTYAASTFLVKPMTATLNDMRHEFAEHGKDKIDELSSRLEKVVSKVPKSMRKDQDLESSDSDGSELFARDNATQTEDATQEESARVTIVEPTATVEQVDKLKKLQKHLDELLEGIKKEGSAAEEREDSTKRLRHYLDSLAYGSSGLNVWSNTGGQFGWEQKSSEQHRDKEKKDDTIEQLKKEIRGVKGVLLSAKRFPPTGRVMPSAAARRAVDQPV